MWANPGQKCRWIGLVPADTFYERQRRESRKRQIFTFELQSGELYAFAGL